MLHRHHFLAAAIAVALFVPASAQDVAKSTRPESPKEFKALKYRNIGPAAGGRVSRAAGVAGQSAPLLRRDRLGRRVEVDATAATTWKSVFDDQPISSIGSIAVAASDPNVIYVGSGEANIRGNVARRQRHLQVDRRRQDVDARLEAGRPDRHDGRRIRRTRTSRSPRCSGTRSARIPSAASTARRDGGKTWQQVLKKDADTGASDVAMDPSNPNDRSSPASGRRAASPGIC